MPNDIILVGFILALCNLAVLGTTLPLVLPRLVKHPHPFFTPKK